MSSLMFFMYCALLVFVLAWVAQLGAHPNSARSTFAAIVMTISIMVLIGSVALTILNLLIRAWS